jgi:putative oxidoreductase
MNILAIVLQSLLALAFLMAAMSKILGLKVQVEGFEHYQLPQWFRVVTGIVEFVSAVGLIIGFWEPSWVAAGALVLGITAVGGVLTHLRVKDSFKLTFPIILLGILSFVLFFIRLSDLTDFPGFN